MNVLAVFVGYLFVVLLNPAKGQLVKIPDEERLSLYWEKMGQKYLEDSLRLRKVNSVAKNVIFFLGDGMGISTVTAMRIFKGQQNKKVGEEEKLAFDEFPFVSLSKTYGIDRQTSDSANTATAYLCGVKANYGTLGLDGRASYENCTSTLDTTTHAKSILQWAQEEGKWTGFVTTTRVTHATPAGLYAHSASRNWEFSTPDSQCKDIASQLVQDVPGKDIRVIMGGGCRNFVPSSIKDKHGQPGSRTDANNLIDQWMKEKADRKAKARVIYDADEMKALDPSDVDYLMGLFAHDHLPYVTDRNKTDKYPTLKEMTDLAIKILSKSPKGFFLLVEGGSIDLAHHQNWAHKALVEGVEFDKAISSAMDKTDEEDTLLVVTADHSHTFTMGGDYPLRGNNILGLGGVSEIDNKTYTTLGYYNGPGYKPNSRDINLTEEEVIDKGYRTQVTIPLQWENHGGEDVAVFARGPMAHLYRGVHDQSYIPYVMGYASCVGPNKQHCNGARTLAKFSQRIFLRLLTLAYMTYAFSIKSLA